MKNKQKQTQLSEADMIETLMGPILDQSANQKVDEIEARGGLMMPREAYIKQQKAEMVEAFHHEIFRMERCMQLTGELLKKHLNLLPQTQKEEISRELERGFREMNELMNHPERVKNETHSLQKILKMEDSTLLWIYQIGHESFTKNRYEEAEALFQFLVMLNGLVCDYWVALGLSQRRLGVENRAIDSFLIASGLNPQNPIPRYNLAEIYCDMGFKEQASAQIEDLFALIKQENRSDLLSSVEVLRDKIRLSRKTS